MAKDIIAVSPQNVNNQICPDCHAPMHFDGVQRYPELGIEYDLYTCETEGCKAQGYTHSFNKRQAEKRADKFTDRDSLTVKARAIEVEMNWNSEVK